MTRVLLLLLVWPLWLSAQFAPPAELIVHIDDDQPQYELLLRLDANALYWIQDESNCRAELEITVALLTTTGVLRHEARLLQDVSLPDSLCTNGPDSVLLVRRALSWFPDLSAAEVRVADRNGSTVFYHEIELQPRPADAALYVSDLLLCDSLGQGFATAQPFASYRLPAERLQLPYYISLYTNRPRSLRLSVQLFLRGEANPGAPSQPYQSVFSEVEPLYLSTGTTQLGRVLPLEGLPSGEYLAEVYVFDEEEILAEVSASFEKAWPGLVGVYQDLPQAVAQLAPRMTAARQQQMQADLNTRGRQVFDAYWAEQAMRYGDQPRRMVERYYQSIADMQDELKLPNAWKTDAGRLWLTYGKPDETRRDTLDGEAYVIWQYNRYALDFVFTADDQQLLN